ncbi:MAG TPA: methyltransferase domain-containing protein [Ktedonobacteraceae bacterium]|nr:methyltransferase domain-containing protein [Ktedonobacteraceae bacterium]
MPTDLSKDPNDYIMDPESATEMARLMNQDRAMTKGMGGLLPERNNNFEGFDNVLDIGCGPGSWVLEAAQSNEERRIVGIDISRQMIQYARAQAFSQRLHNAEFEIANALEPMPFDDGSFDLVNARFIVGFTPIGKWPSFLKECMRILRPGGVIRLTEGDLGTSTSPSFDEIGVMLAKLLKMAGFSFSHDEKSIGIIIAMRRLLTEAGFENVRKMAHLFETRPGDEGYGMWMDNFKVTYSSLLPIFIQMHITTQEKFDELYAQALRDIIDSDFCTLSYFVTMWATKPQ